MTGAPTTDGSVEFAFGSESRRGSVSGEGVKQQFFKTQMCTFYKEARCPFPTDQCSFAHDPAELRHAPDLTKTKLCPKAARCRGRACQYAHSVEELRSTDLYFKSRLCKFFQQHQRCSLGDKCRFAHGHHELRSPPTDSVTSSPVLAPSGLPDSPTGRHLSDASPLVFTPNGWTRATTFFPTEVFAVSPELLRLQSEEPYED